MLIGDLGATTGVPPQTIRYYERRGLLPEPRRESNGYRRYDPEAAVRLGFIRSAQAAGLTLTEIGGIIHLRQVGEAPCGHVAALLNDKLEDVRARQRDLALLEAELRQLVAASRELDPADCAEGEICHIIARPHR